MPTSPLPRSLIFWKLLGETSTLRVLIELELYVRLKTALCLESADKEGDPGAVGALLPDGCGGVPTPRCASDSLILEPDDEPSVSARAVRAPAAIGGPVVIVAGLSGDEGAVPFGVRCGGSEAVDAAPGAGKGYPFRLRSSIGEAVGNAEVADEAGEKSSPALAGKTDTGAMGVVPAPAPLYFPALPVWGNGGTGGTFSLDCSCRLAVEGEKRAFALGAETTRRRNLAMLPRDLVDPCRLTPAPCSPGDCAGAPGVVGIPSP